MNSLVQRCSGCTVDPVDAKRRSLLVCGTSVVGSAGLMAAAYPFVASLEPSARARAEAQPVTTSIADLKPGQMQTLAWRGRPVWVLRRDDAMIRSLEHPNPALADPDSLRSEQPPSCRNATRSIRPDVFVAIGLCTHLGCSPVLRLGDHALEAELGVSGGFVCPCHGSRFDLAGRVVRNVPAPTNLQVPDYRFDAPDRLTVGA